MEELFRDGPTGDRRAWATTLVERSVRDLDREDLHGVLRAFHWDNLRVTGEPMFKNLVKVYRRTVVDALAERVTELLDRRISNGVFDRSLMRRRRPRGTAQDRRDLALTPRFTPPGRT